MDKIMDSNITDKTYAVVLSIKKEMSGLVNMIIENKNDIKDIKFELHNHEKRIENLEIKNVEED